MNLDTNVGFGLPFQNVIETTFLPHFEKVYWPLFVPNGIFFPANLNNFCLEGVVPDN